MAIESAFHRTQARHRTVGEWFNLPLSRALLLMCMNLEAMIHVHLSNLDPDEIEDVRAASGLFEAKAKLLAMSEARHGPYPHN